MKMVWWKPSLVYTKELVIFVDIDFHKIWVFKMFVDFI